MRKLLVVGARPASLGAWVATLADRLSFGERWDVTTAGVSEDEMFKLDLTWSDEQMYPFLEEWGPFHAVVCTAGINPVGSSIADVPGPAMLEEAIRINYLGHLNLLYNWVRYWHEGSDGAPPPLSWVSISSNSAHVARTKSMAYCSSKAALSMAIRVAGRELAGGPFSVYGYEPGWLIGTPMSEHKELELRGVSMVGRPLLPPHRIPGGHGIDPADLAMMIVRNLDNDRALNGTLVRVDGGEQ